MAMATATKRERAREEEKKDKCNRNGTKRGHPPTRLVHGSPYTRSGTRYIHHVDVVGPCALLVILLSIKTNDYPGSAVELL